MTAYELLLRRNRELEGKLALQKDAIAVLESAVRFNAPLCPVAEQALRRFGQLRAAAQGRPA